MFENINTVDVLVSVIAVLLIALAVLYVVMKVRNKRNLETLVNMVDIAMDKEFAAIDMVDKTLNNIKSGYHLQEFTENRINTARSAKNTLQNALDSESDVNNLYKEVNDYIFQKLKVSAIKNRNCAETDNVVELKAVVNNR
tara:strand:+ start:2297 stop:2719 length:423 start_codon:yes stop_codon:yes gene_type:complete